MSPASASMNLDKLEAALNTPREQPQSLPPRRELTEDIEDNQDDVSTTELPTVGKLTAEVINKDYNATAEHLKAVINELLQTAKQCEDLMHEIMETSAVLKDAADRFQKRGQEIAGQLQISSDTTTKVRAAAMEWVHMIDSTSPK